MSTTDASAEARERAHVLDDRLVVRGVLERNENALVHRQCPPVRSCTSSHTFSAAMKTATKYESTRSHAGFANSPIFSAIRREAHEREYGERELQAENDLTEDQQLRRAGLAIENGDHHRRHNGERRVMSRRSHGRIRMLRNPSITICPASVPVSVEFWPDASSASANTVLAPPTPSSGVSSLYAS